MKTRYFVNLLPENPTKEEFQYYIEKYEQVRFDLFQHQDYIVGALILPIEDGMIAAIEFEDEKQMNAFKKAYDIEYDNPHFDSLWPDQDTVRKNERERLRSDTMKAVEKINKNLEEK